MMLVLSFQGHIVGTPVPNPSHHVGFVSILVRDSANQIMQPLRITSGAGIVGLSMGWAAQIDFKSSVTSFELVLGCGATPGVVEVFDSGWQLLHQIPIDASGRASYAASDIRRLFVRSPEDETCLALLKLEGVAKTAAAREGLFDQSINLDEELSDAVCAEVVFGETATLRAPNAEAQLVSGRTFIAAVAFDRYLDDPTRFAPRKHPTAKELQDPSIKKHWDLCNDAAKAGRSLDIGNCRHFVIWPIDQDGKAPAKAPAIPDTWPYDYASKIAERYGPLKSYGQPSGDNVHIFKYCGVP